VDVVHPQPSDEEKADHLLQLVVRAQGGENGTWYRLQLTSLSYFGLLTYIFELGQLIRMAML